MTVPVGVGREIRLTFRRMCMVDAEEADGIVFGTWKLSMVAGRRWGMGRLRLARDEHVKLLAELGRTKRAVAIRIGDMLRVTRELALVEDPGHWRDP